MQIFSDGETDPSGKWMNIMLSTLNAKYTDLVCNHLLVLSHCLLLVLKAVLTARMS